jgi:hypothetical protein
MIPVEQRSQLLLNITGKLVELASNVNGILVQYRYLTFYLHCSICCIVNFSFLFPLLYNYFRPYLKVLSELLLGPGLPDVVSYTAVVSKIAAMVRLFLTVFVC